MDWIGLARHSNRWRILVNAVMNLRVPLNTGAFFTSEELLASREGLCSTELVKGSSNYELTAIKASFHLS